MTHAEQAKKLLSEAIGQIDWQTSAGLASRAVDHIIAAAVEAMREELQGRANSGGHDA